MIILPFTPSTPSEAMLADYLRGAPFRLPILQRVLALLEEDGSVGDIARYYVIRKARRRAVLRGVLIALGFKLPTWLMEGSEAAAANRRFASSCEEALANGDRQGG